MSEIITNNEIINETENTNGNMAATASSASISVSKSTLEFDSNAASEYVKVTCPDTTWTVGGGVSWCTITKVNTTTAKIRVTENTGSARATGVVCRNGSSYASILVKQAAPETPELPDPIDLSDMITHYAQDAANNCAGICACMCVNDSPNNVRTKCKDSSVLCPANWTKIANTYGYEPSSDPPASGTIDDVYDVLKMGYPVITHFKGSSTRLEHWVVVTGYDGDGTDMSPSNFTCDDPLKSNPVRLDEATNFSTVDSYIYFKKM